jgi:hypothetical protein
VPYNLVQEPVEVRATPTKAGGVGGHPATEGGGVLTELGVIEVGFGVALVAGEFMARSGRASNLLAKGEKIRGVKRCFVELCEKTRGAKMILVDEVRRTARIL